MSDTILPKGYKLKDSDYVCVVTQGQKALLPAKQIGTGETLDVAPAASITDAAAGIDGSVRRIGDVIETSIVIDLTGLRSTAAGDILGDDGSSEYAYIAQIKADVNGTIFAGKIECLEAPTGGDPDIDLYSAVEGTGTEDTAISTLDETQLTNGGDHTAGGTDVMTAYPGADEYLYLVAGATTDADYTAGILVITLYGR